MKAISNEELISFVNSHIDEFHQSKALILKGLNLKKILKAKNPYLFKAKNLNSAYDLINDILSAYLYSSEEKVFGDFLERLAKFVSERTCGGRKSGTTGIDLEFDDEGIRYLVSIKSGPSWGNSSSIAKQELDFRKAVSIIKQGNPKINVEPILGICYGKTRTSYVRGYKKVVGQSFWYLISGDPNIYKQIIEPIGYKAKEYNESFIIEKNRIINLFTQEFMDKFCDNGVINWEKLVEFNSGNILNPDPA